ncbi:MAG: hypothetical protein HC833_00970 [Leptolyngbyaceae cyanobacterium RM1_406_9]|nr:hypothetical protein [Leptolyngbyaceae cyanobacterium RM1_406_9]
MKLSGSQFKRLRESLLSVFLKEEGLDDFLLEELDVPLQSVIEGGTYPQKVLALIKWAGSEGRLAELLVAARQNHPGNIELKALFSPDSIAFLSPWFEVNTEILNLHCLEKFDDFRPFYKELVEILKEYKVFNDFIQAVISTIPDLKGNRRVIALTDLENSALPASVRLFILLHLFVQVYPQVDNKPGLVQFAYRLFCNCPSTSLKKQLLNWLQQIEKQYSYGLVLESPLYREKIQPSPILEMCLMVKVAPPQKTKPNQFLLEGFLGILDLNSGAIQEIVATFDIDPEQEPDEQQEKGIPRPLQRIPSEVVQMIKESEQRLIEEARDRNSKPRGLIVEIFLPYKYLGEAVDQWNIEEAHQRVPIGRRHRVALRSYERFSEPALRIDNEDRWDKIHVLLEKLVDQDLEQHIEPIEEIDLVSWKAIARRLQNKIGLKLVCGLPESVQNRENLFAALALESSVPIALWSRAGDIPNIDLYEALGKFLTVQSMRNLGEFLEHVRLERTEAYLADHPHLSLGHHLAVFCDHPRRLPEFLPLSEFG